MLEIEVKYRVLDLELFQSRLDAMRPVKLDLVRERDHYFDAPNRDFRESDEAFRLRRVGMENRLTYKGPKRISTAKIREEIEVAIASGEDAARQMLQMLERLGYREVAIVEKQRIVHQLAFEGFEVNVCRDEVTGTGLFAEIEILAEESGLESAQAVVLKIADQLGLTEIERRSYLRMVLESRS